MYLRIWRTKVDPARVDEFYTFARERSLPMFNEQDGFIDVFFGEGPDDHVTVTLWEDEQSIEALERSASYGATVAAINATGLLRGDQSVEVFRLRP